MSDFPRYAIYYAPAAETAFARFGAAMLGYDADTGEAVPYPADIIASVSDWQELTRDPRKYGFHATLKAPFALADDTNEAQLAEACARFAVAPRSLPEIVPVVRTIDGFTAIVPNERSAALDALAQACVESFDAFRAPLTASDRARRKPETLTARQVLHLDTWGYPYVGDDFRFHMTLTGRLPHERRANVLAMLERHVATLDLPTLAIDRIVLFRQDTATTAFRVVRSFPLHGTRRTND